MLTIELPIAVDANSREVACDRHPLRAPKLSAREIEVLVSWILNDSKSSVCEQLYISPGTVNTHLSRIREKYESVGRPAPTKAIMLARALQDGHIILDQL
ncbi:helix-turn-helix transcriptional regulator [Antrihabitans stalactiti]|uniref:helix-turn-helix transcriptional regulator n=1 Tax=Antrihabitans stalactiti TaxID=2584121 RepID=UPI0030B7F7EF